MNDVDITIDDIAEQIKERLVVRQDGLEMNQSFIAGLEVASLVVETYLIDLKWRVRAGEVRIVND